MGLVARVTIPNVFRLAKYFTCPTVPFGIQPVLYHFLLGNSHTQHTTHKEEVIHLRLGCKNDGDAPPPYTPEILIYTKVSGCKKGRQGSPREKVAFLGLKTQFP